MPATTPSPSAMSLATMMIIAPTSFFLGMLFSLFMYDYHLLWSRIPVTAEHLDKIEVHLRLLYNSPNLIIRVMHIITALGLVGIVIKLYKPTESNLLFDGGSLVLYMIAVIVYLTNIVKGLRIVDAGVYGVNLKELTQDQLDEVDMAGNNAETGDTVLGREDNLKVLAASNTIAALVLLGVIVLQVGQWYADRVEAREKAKAEEEHNRKQKEMLEGKSTGAASPAPEGETVKRGGSKKNK